MRPDASSHLRIARPSHDLARAERFWTHGLGLQVLHRTPPANEHQPALLMLGWPDAAWHLELVADPTGRTLPTPTDEDLLVLYLARPIENDLVNRLITAGGQRVPSHSSYWDRWGITIQDTDGYRLVLSHRTWP
jgi:catechol 2,3-dioxygenase-like lactoylglutathione lyase family enzyme